MASGDVWNNEFLADSLTEAITRNEELTSKVLVSEDVWNDGISIKTNITDKWELGGFDINGGIIQPGNTVDADGNSFTPKGSLVPELHLGQVHKGKIDILFKEADMERMLPTMLRTFGAAFIESIPFEELVLMMIWQKAKDEVYCDLAWGGVKANTNASTAIADGFLKLITTAIANVATTGEAALKKIPAGQIFTAAAYTNTNAVAQFKGQHRLVPEKIRKKDMVTFCANDLEEFYNDDFLTRYGAMSFDNRLLDDGKQYIHRTKNKIVPRDGMSGSERVIMTPYDNLEVGFLNEGDLTNVKFQKFNRDIKIMADFKVGFDIHNYDRLWVNSRV
jgi:hypothetical protein